MDALLTLADGVRLGLGALLAAVGMIFVLGGAIGQLRFPDFYARTHAANVASAVGAPVAALGLAFCAGAWSGFIKLALLAALLSALAPIVSQMLANAAHSAGLAPLSGVYVAPRPGAPKPRGTET